LFFFTFFIASLGISQSSDPNAELKSISEKLKSITKYEGELYEEGVQVSLQNDTLYVYNYRGNPPTKIYTEFHYFLNVKDIENVEYKTIQVGEHSTELLSFTSKGFKPLFIFKYGSRSEILDEIKKGLSEDDMQNYSSVVLPIIKDKKILIKLESILKGLLTKQNLIKNIHKAINQADIVFFL
jgi:hypothetical protein